MKALLTEGLRTIKKAAVAKAKDAIFILRSIVNMGGLISAGTVAQFVRNNQIKLKETPCSSITSLINHL